MTRPNVLDRAISTRSEESTDAAMTVMRTLRAGLVPVPVLESARVLPATETILPRTPRMKDTTAAKVVVSATEQT